MANSHNYCYMCVTRSLSLELILPIFGFKA